MKKGARQWNSQTLPPVPSPSVLHGIDTVTDAHNAALVEMVEVRSRVVAALSHAERCEASAARARGEANKLCDHYGQLLESLLTDPLF